MKHSFYSLIVASALILALAGCGGGSDEPVFREIQFRKDGTLQVIQPGDSIVAVFNIEIAEGDSAQARGLMERRSLPPMSGMLFVGDAVEEKSFWMENTPMPLDIIFIGPDSSVVSIAERTRPYSRESIASEGPAQFVLEVRAGMVNRIDLKELHDRYGADLLHEQGDTVDHLTEDGLIVVRDHHLALTDEGKLLANPITERLLLDD